jgi:hypothetical protein
MKSDSMVLGVFFGAFLLNAMPGESWAAGPGAGSQPAALENGDINGDWSIDLSDPIYLFNYLFTGGPAPVPLACLPEFTAAQNGDANGDGSIDLSDGIRILGWLFNESPPPVPACGAGLGGGATADSTPFTADFGPPSGGSPAEREWLEGGVFHFRNAVELDPISGDINGTATLSTNGDIDTVGGRGHLFGSFLLEVTWQGLSGTWSGHYSVTFSSGDPASGQFAGAGDGGLAGTKLLGTITESGPGTFQLEGVILSPQE